MRRKTIAPCDTCLRVIRCQTGSYGDGIDENALPELFLASAAVLARRNAVKYTHTARTVVAYPKSILIEPSEYFRKRHRVGRRAYAKRAVCARQRVRLCSHVGIAARTAQQSTKNAGSSRRSGSERAEEILFASMELHVQITMPVDQYARIHCSRPHSSASNRVYLGIRRKVYESTLLSTTVI